MNRKQPRVAVYAVLPCLLVAISVSAVECSVAPGDAEGSVTLLYIADVHGHMEPHPELFWHDGKTEIATAGGLSRIAAAVDSIRREQPGQVIFLDAGDIIQGSGAAALTEEHCLCEPYNRLGLDLAVPGNWSVVYGKNVLTHRCCQFLFPFVAANVKHGDGGQMVFPPAVMIERGGVRVGIIGYTDPDIPERQPPSYSKGLRFQDAAETLPALIADLRDKRKADLVVLVTHTSLAKSVDLAEKLSGIDVLFSGDTHERTYEPIVRGDTWIVEPRSFGSLLGRLDISIAEGKLSDRKWELIELRAEAFSEDPIVGQAVDEALGPMRERLEEVIGHTEIPLYRYAVVESRLDLVLADALRDASETDIAISNGFRFGYPIRPGPIRAKDLWVAYPVVEKLKTGKASGWQLRAFWERELENCFAEDPTERFGGWVPRPSGMSVRFKAHAPKGERVLEVRVGGKRIEDDRTYTLTACRREGDSPDTLCRIGNVRDPKVLDIDVHPGRAAASEKPRANHVAGRRPRRGDGPARRGTVAVFS